MSGMQNIDEVRAAIARLHQCRRRTRQNVAKVLTNHADIYCGGTSYGTSGSAVRIENFFQKYSSSVPDFEMHNHEIISSDSEEDGDQGAERMDTSFNVPSYSADRVASSTAQGQKTPGRIEIRTPAPLDDTAQRAIRPQLLPAEEINGAEDRCSPNQKGHGSQLRITEANGSPIRAIVNRSERPGEMPSMMVAEGKLEDSPTGKVSVFAECSIIPSKPKTLDAQLETQPALTKEKTFSASMEKGRKNRSTSEQDSGSEPELVQSVLDKRIRLRWPTSPTVKKLKITDRLFLRKEAYPPFRSYPTEMHTDDSIEFASRVIWEDTRFNPNEKDQASAVVLSNTLVLDKVRGLRKHRKGGRDTWKDLQAQAAELDRFHPPSPMLHDWYLIPQHLRSDLTEGGHFELVAIHGMRNVFSSYYCALLTKQFTKETNAKELIDLEKGGLLFIVDSNGSQPPPIQWEAILHFIRLLFVLTMEKENACSNKKRTRSRAVDCFELPLLAVVQIHNLYSNLRVVIQGPQQDDGTSCGSFVLTHLRMSRRTAFLNAIANRLTKTLLLDEPLPEDEFERDKPHEVSIPSLFFPEDVHHTMELIQEIIEDKINAACRPVEIQ